MHTVARQARSGYNYETTINSVCSASRIVAALRSGLTKSAPIVRVVNAAMEWCRAIGIGSIKQVFGSLS